MKNLFLAVVVLSFIFMSCSEDQSAPMSNDLESLSKKGVHGDEEIGLAKQSFNFKAHLNGAGAGTESQGQGQAIFRFNKDVSELYYKVNLANIENVTMAHIHLASVPGGNGPPVLWLYPDGPPPQLIEGSVNGTLAEGTVSSSRLVGPLAGKTLNDLQEAILQGLTYVNVHTSQFPGGEVRGDID